MKILYGVQGTGNGHITRARMLAKHFKNTELQVTYLFSGRQPEQLFDMQAFGNFMHRRGLTFKSENGTVSYLKTLLGNNFFKLLQEIWQLDVSQYDLIISDFEPVTAWAGRLRGVPVLGIGHQYAFDFNVPIAGESMMAKFIMRHFAPVSKSLGMHWHHFNHPIFPPIIDTSIGHQTGRNNKRVLVYLPFENQQQIQALLRPLTDYQFIVYAPQSQDIQSGNLHLKNTSLQGFKTDLQAADAVICNTGFELISECLHLGVSVLTKPLHKQMEQLSNARVLQELGYAKVSEQLASARIKKWLDNNKNPVQIALPDVGEAIVSWLAMGQKESLLSLSDRLWAQVEVRK